VGAYTAYQKPDSISRRIDLDFSAGPIKKASLNGNWNIRQAGIGSFANLIAVPGFWRRTFSETEMYQKASYFLPNPFSALEAPFPSWNSADYAVKFFLPAAYGGTPDKILNLHFDAVSAQAEVYINGILAGTHLGIYDPFNLNIEKYVYPNQDNIILVRVTDSSVFEPGTGTTLVIPQTIYEHDQGGIWQSVALESISPAPLGPDIPVPPPAQITWLSAYSSGLTSLRSYTAVQNQGSAQILNLQLELIDKTTGQTFKTVAKTEIAFAAHENKTITWQVDNLAGAKTWSPENPNLYTLKMTLYSLNDGFKIVHHLKEAPFGFKTFSIANNKFLLNGAAYFLKGVPGKIQVLLMNLKKNTLLWPTQYFPTLL